MRRRDDEQEWLRRRLEERVRRDKAGEDEARRRLSAVEGAEGDCAVGVRRRAEQEVLVGRRGGVAVQAFNLACSAVEGGVVEAGDGES